MIKKLVISKLILVTILSQAIFELVFIA